MANKHLKVKAPPSGGRKKRGAEAAVGKSAFVAAEGGGEGGAGAGA